MYTKGNEDVSFKTLVREFGFIDGTIMWFWAD